MVVKSDFPHADREFLEYARSRMQLLPLTALTTVAEGVSRVKLQEPVQMVRHDDVGERRCADCSCFAVQGAHDDAAEIEIREQTLTVACHCCDEIDLAADRRSSSQ